MTELTQAIETPDRTETAQPVDRRSPQLYRMLAWVGIVAGTLVIVAAVFFSGFLAGRATGGDGWHGGFQSGQSGSGGPMAQTCPMMQMQGGGTGPGGMDPGSRPGMGPGGMVPGDARASTPPSTMPPAGQR